jgi:hypothetical protein
MGYYWPTLLQDAKKYVHGCDIFQRMVQSIQLYEIPLNVQLAIEPFEKWALEFMGPSIPHPVRRPTSWFAETKLPNGSKPLEKTSQNFCSRTYLFALECQKK